VTVTVTGATGATGATGTTGADDLNRVLALLPERVAVPRRNGEPVFDAPWQSRAFGMVVTMHQQGVFPWSAFKTLLIEEVGKADGDGTGGYYDHWVAAFQRLLAELEVLTPEQMDTRAGEFLRGDRRGLA
jgi:nitrile hydratase accessory protein